MVRRNTLDECCDTAIEVIVKDDSCIIAEHLIIPTVKADSWINHREVKSHVSESAPVHARILF